MDYLSVIIFGVVQGITEFLPVSSSGHLVILHELLSLPFENDLAFDVALHFATLLAVLYFFRRDVVQLAVGFLSSLRGQKTEMSRLSWLLIMGAVPAAILGFLFDDLIEQRFRSLWIVITMLIVVALLFILVEKKGRFSQEYVNIKWPQALFIGLAQALALIPGTSRSGITIITGLAVGLKREAAIRFSFLLSIPIVAGAAIVKIPDILAEKLSLSEWSLILVAFLSALFSGVFAIRFLINFARSHTLIPFAVYRIILALILILYNVL